MKTAKRLLTAALAVLFTFMCALPAMADDLVNQETYTLTIDNSRSWAIPTKPTRSLKVLSA